MSAAATTDGVDFVVKRDDWRQCRFIPAAVESELQPGQVLFRVDRFAFTSNNVSYALAGDMLGYWRFFPAAEGWGRLRATSPSSTASSATTRPSPMTISRPFQQPRRW